MTLEQFDRVMSVLLRESVRGEEPSDKVRGRLLRAAAAVRQQPIHPYYEVIERRRGRLQLAAWREETSQTAIEQRVMVDMLQSQMIGLRFIA